MHDSPSRRFSAGTTHYQRLFAQVLFSLKLTNWYNFLPSMILSWCYQVFMQLMRWYCQVSHVSRVGLVLYHKLFPMQLSEITLIDQYNAGILHTSKLLLRPFPQSLSEH